MTTSLQRLTCAALAVAASAAITGCNVSSAEGEDTHYEFDPDPSGLETSAANAGAMEAADGVGEQALPGADARSAAVLGRVSPTAELNRGRLGLGVIEPQATPSDDSETSSVGVAMRLDGNLSYSVDQEEQ
jgi:hypothetical protein